jgi:putative NIF3 family GTP cyclohydrolase 1 type 2
MIVRAVESRVAVYSPHTALDCMGGGVNDWLLAGLGQGRVQALSISSFTSSPSSVLSIRGVQEDKVDIITGALPNALPTHSSPCSSNPKLYDVTIPCTEAEVVSTVLHLNANFPHGDISLQSKPLTPMAAAGRKLTLEHPVSLSELVARVKAHLSLSHVRLARPTHDHTVATVAACAGSGGKVLGGSEADVYLTGEMGHHEVLAATSRGTAVILCEHSNTERGFLHIYRSLVQARAGPDVAIALATVDSDPLVVV